MFILEHGAQRLVHPGELKMDARVCVRGGVFVGMYVCNRVCVGRGGDDGI